MSAPGGPPLSSCASVDAPPTATDVHVEARKIHDAFIAKARVLIGIPDSDASFGKHVMKPSQLADMMNDAQITQFNILAMTRGPMYGQDGKLMGLSIDAAGKMITAEQFNAEVVALAAAGDVKFAELQNAVTACNVAMRELAAKHGLTASDLYTEINRRAGF